MIQICTTIENALRSHSASADIPAGYTQDDVYNAVRSVMRENPDLFWFSHQWHYEKKKAEKSTRENEGTNAIVCFRYTIDEKRSDKISLHYSYSFLLQELTDCTSAWYSLFLFESRIYYILHRHRCAQADAQPFSSFATEEYE